MSAVLKEILSEDEMLQFGSQLSRAITTFFNQQKDASPLLIYLYGFLGSGKTTLVRGFLRALGVSGKIKSPTYSLVEVYEVAGQPIFHFDLYRINDPAELQYLGIKDYFVDKHICLIEWPEQGKGFLPQADLNLHIEFDGDHKRKVRLDAQSKSGAIILAALSDF